tara:strand:+ start:204 stop:578 length:375 start_codon:yes stop_codon:yes gene_type:complete
LTILTTKHKHNNNKSHHRTHTHTRVERAKKEGTGGTMRVTKFLQMAVKKGPFARGGLKWKGHGAFRVTQTRKTNAKKRLKYVNENDSVLREAAANDASMTMMRAMNKEGESSSGSDDNSKSSTE